ncbi:MAG: hypothetical protein K2Y23_25755 [Cyanobacteria bacterium]|nr:hypothetical protein [Cyanobacteriota bacterium]
MTGHSYFLLASVFADEDARSEELATLIKGKSWREAAAFQDWLGDRDERQYYLVRCSSGGGLSLFKVVSTAAYWSDDFVESRELLDTATSETINQIVGDRWRPM